MLTCRGRRRLGASSRSRDRASVRSVMILAAGSSPLARSAQRALRQMGLAALGPCPTVASLPPLAPPELPGLIATMAALTSAGCLSASCPGRSPAFTPHPFPGLPPPTTLASPHTASAALAVCGAAVPGDGLRPWLAGSPICLRRIVFTLVAAGLAPSDAPHPASRRRSFFRSSVGHRPRPVGVSHPEGLRCSAAH